MHLLVRIRCIFFITAENTSVTEDNGVFVRFNETAAFMSV